MSNQDWLARYSARKRGQVPQQPPQPQYAPPPPPPQYAPPQAYAPPPPGLPQQYMQPPPPPGPQPIPGAPQHAPFGYDQMTGQPLAPYGRDQYGNVVVQPVYYQQPPPYPQQPQQPAYDPRGQVMPQGYGQPPYGVPGPPQAPTVIDPNTGQPMVHAMDAVAAYQGGKGVAAAQACPECGGPMMPTNATNESRVLNTKTGEFAHPAGHCMNCGYNGITRPGESTGALAGSANGVRVNVVGTVAAPGGGSLQQVAGQHGLPNLFAPRSS